MSADTPEQDAPGDVELRQRFLPISRKELRRRREAGLSAQRAAQEQAEATSDELAAGAGAPAETETDDELARAVEDTEASEVIELPAPPERSGDAADHDDDPADAEPAGAGDETESLEPEQHSSADEDSAEAPEAVLPEPAEPDQPARPEEEAADAADQEEPDVALTAEEVDELTADQDEQLLDEDTGESEVDTEDDDPQHGSAPEGDQAELVDEEEAPIPASRRAHRLLRETEDLPTLDTGLMQAVHETTDEIAAADDPNRVDPELLKKQQALAAKAMQANQERMRQKQAEDQANRKGPSRPESSVITGRTLRDSQGPEYEHSTFLTGQIAPVDAEGAHGLDLNQMLDETSRQAGRQNMFLWVSIVLAVLLAAALVVIFIL